MTDREKVIRIIDELIVEAQKEPNWKAESALKCLKKELLKEQEEDKPRGHWMPYEPDKRGYTDGYIFMCSCCEKYSIRNNYPYCHWCGAKMEGR